jgi:hypothetical protein
MIDSTILIWTSLGITAIVAFIILIWWAEREIKRHPELVGQRNKNYPMFESEGNSTDL